MPCFILSPKWTMDWGPESLAKQFLFRQQLCPSCPSPEATPFLPVFFPPAATDSPQGSGAASQFPAPGFCLEICPPIWAGPYQGPPALQSPPVSGTGSPPSPQRGENLLPEAHLSTLMVGSYTSGGFFATSSPLLCQDQAHFMSWECLSWLSK